MLTESDWKGERLRKNKFASETLNPLGGLTLRDIGKVNPNAPPLGAARSTYGPPVNLKDKPRGIPNQGSLR